MFHFETLGDFVFLEHIAILEHFEVLTHFVFHFMMLQHFVLLEQAKELDSILQPLQDIFATPPRVWEVRYTLVMYDLCAGVYTNALL